VVEERSVLRRIVIREIVIFLFLAIFSVFVYHNSYDIAAFITQTEGLGAVGMAIAIVYTSLCFYPIYLAIRFTIWAIKTLRRKETNV
jgi:hypothetical protein